MPRTPYSRGGPTVPINDGGTGGEDAATARANLAALNEAAHDALDHSGLTGINSFDQAAHDAHDHSGVPGAGGAETPTFTGSISPTGPLNGSHVVTKAGAVVLVVASAQNPGTLAVTVNVNGAGQQTTSNLPAGNSEAVNVAVNVGDEVTLQGAGGSAGTYTASIRIE